MQIIPDVVDFFSIHCLRKLQLHLRENISQPGRKRKEIYIIALLEGKENQINLYALDDL